MFVPPYQGGIERGLFRRKRTSPGPSLVRRGEGNGAGTPSLRSKGGGQILLRSRRGLCDLGLGRPGFEDGLDQRSQRDGEERSPEAPGSSKH